MAGLSGWDEICKYAKRSESTLRKWQKKDNFPVAVVSGSVISDTTLIDNWFRNKVSQFLDGLGRDTDPS